MRKVDRVFVADGEPLATAFVGLRVPMHAGGEKTGEAVVVKVERGSSWLASALPDHVMVDGVYVDLEYDVPDALFGGLS